MVWLQGRLRQLKQAADAAGAELQRTVADGASREALLQARIVELTAEAARGADIAASLRQQVRALLGAAQDAAMAQGALQVSPGRWRTACMRHQGCRRLPLSWGNMGPICMKLQCTAAADGNGALLASLKRRLHLCCAATHVMHARQALSHCLFIPTTGREALPSAPARGRAGTGRWLAGRAGSGARGGGRLREQVPGRAPAAAPGKIPAQYVSVLGDEAASTTTPGVFMNLPTE